MTTPLCVHGHPWTPDNTYIDPRGYRQCIRCHRRRCAEDRDRRFTQRHNGHRVVLDSAGRRFCLTCKRPSTSRDHDDIAVLRAVQADPPERLTTSERRDAAQALARRGHTVRDIADQLGISERTIFRYLADTKQEAAA